jgi:hypothetical protein
MLTPIEVEVKVEVEVKFVIHKPYLEKRTGEV